MKSPNDVCTAVQDVVSVITVRAISVKDHGNGLVTLEFPARVLSEAEAHAIESLFPNLPHKAHELLNQEALIQSLATDADFRNPPRPDKKPKY